jgi:rRNA maturation RNase YbeY
MIFGGSAVALAQCEKHNHLMEDHIPVLINHGLWHCLGYDHESDEDYEIMKQKCVSFALPPAQRLARIARGSSISGAAS